LFTASSVLKDNFVMLEDDKGLQGADNPTAIINESKVTDDITRILDAVNEKLTTEEYNTMSLGISEDKEDPDKVAADFLERAALETGDTGAGTSLTVGSKDFAGAQAISQAYGQALAANGYDISYKENIGPTETVYPLAKDGTIDLYADYTGTLVNFLGGTQTADYDETYEALQAALEGEGLVATTPAHAQDVNAFYVTSETADQYDLTKISDLTVER
jgi:osmoprotectant transport system substrate-binding protein